MQTILNLSMPCLGGHHGDLYAPTRHGGGKKNRLVSVTKFKKEILDKDHPYKNLSQPGNGKPKKDILSLEPSYIHRLIYPGIYPLFFAFLNSSLDSSWDLSPAFWIPNFIFGFCPGIYPLLFAILKS